MEWTSGQSTDDFRTGEYDMQEMEADISNGMDFRSVNRGL